MAKANNTDIYKYNEYPSLLDYLFGADFEDYKKNKSFRLNSIIQLINNVNGINNTQFIFSDGSDSEVSYFDKGYFFTDNNETNPDNFTKLILNKESLQPINLTLLFERLAGIGNLVLKLENPENPNNFFNFKITGITDETDFFIFDVVIFEDFYFGELLNETIYSVYFDIKTDGVVQDNIKKEILIDCPNQITLANFATIINALPSFSISDIEIPIFKAVSNDVIPTAYYVELLNIGKGNYGISGTVLTPTNIKVTSFGATSTDIANLPTTQTIDLENQGASVVDAINIQIPNIIIQDQNDGYVIIKGIFDGQFHEYLWTGTGGAYGGDSGLQSTALDFKEISAIINPTDDYILKQESNDFLVSYYDAVIEQVDLNDHRASLNFMGTNTDVKSIALSGEFMRNGKIFTFKNHNATPLTIWHNSGTGNVKIMFSNEENFILQPNEVIQFSLNYYDTSIPRLEYIGIITNNNTSNYPYNIFKFIQKGFGNTNQTIAESGDLYCGWRNDGLVRYTEASYISGALNNSDNFIPLVQTEI